MLWPVGQYSCVEWECYSLVYKLEITKVIASHDLELIAQTCSRVVLMENGKIISGGPCQDFLSETALHF